MRGLGPSIFVDFQILTLMNMGTENKLIVLNFEGEEKRPLSFQEANLSNDSLNKQSQTQQISLLAYLYDKFQVSPEISMTNLKKSIIYGLAGLAVTGTGFVLNEYLKSNKPEKDYRPMCTLMGDVGGTNVRFQLNLIQPPHNQPIKLYKKKTYPVTRHQHFIDALKEFLEDVEVYPEVAVIGIAGPIDENRIRMANVPKWGEMVGEDLGKQLGIKSFTFINDFQAISYGILLLGDQDFVSVNGKNIVEDKTRGVIGPGTGLGTSVLYTSPFRKRNRVYVLPSEGGHTDFCYIDQQSADFFEFMRDKTGFEYISRERSFCGPAIPHMFSFFAQRFPDLPDSDKTPTSQEIISKCRQEIDDMDEQKSLYHKTLNMFIKLYSNAIGNFIAHHMCTGGVYLVGSLTKAILPFIQKKDLTAAYVKRHPEFESTIEKVPIVVCREIDLGLKGAYVYARRIIADNQHE